MHHTEFRNKWFAVKSGHTLVVSDDDGNEETLQAGAKFWVLDSDAIPDAVWFRVRLDDGQHLMNTEFFDADVSLEIIEAV